MGRGYLFYVFIWWAILAVWNLVCLKLHKGNFLSSPIIHHFEMIGDKFLEFFRTWGKLCHSTTNTNCFVRAIYLSCKSVVWIPYGGHICSTTIYTSWLWHPSSLWQDFLTVKYIWYWQMQIREQNLYAPIPYWRSQYILGSVDLKDFFF